MSEVVFPPQSIHDVFNSRAFGARQWTVFAMCFLVTALEGFDTTVIGFVAPAISAQWALPPSALAPLVGTGLAGILLGSIAGGTLADRYGRKWVGAAAIAWFALTSLGSAQSASVMQLVVWRFATGCGVGAAMPVMSALVAEYCSDKARASMLAATFCGFLFGAASAGFATASLIDSVGWRGMLMLSGVAPLLVLLGFVARVPESPRHMLVRGCGDGAIRRTMQTIFPDLDTRGLTLDSANRTGRTDPPRHVRGGVLSQDLRTGTLLIWAAEFCGYLVFFLVGSWLPTYLKNTGLSIAVASQLSAMFQFGALGGAVLFAWAVRRINVATVVAVAFGAGVALIVALGALQGRPGYPAMVFLSGMTVGGPLICINTISGIFYPTALRASGGGWTLAIGRLGSIVGSMLIGLIVSSHASFAIVCLSLAAPLLVACLAMIGMRPAMARATGGIGAGLSNTPAASRAHPAKSLGTEHPTGRNAH
ncbi:MULTISPECIES: MFS transporter [Pandoraea]|uniref:MFS transporter n=1 Tax=Pandoraea TaxID=93217 RepID=UPI001F5C54F9|nr:MULTISPECIES: MFS transporter [Pandoraea]MCI3208296.1 hypothetical protein [Pandoraea sp. LA3]MDN4586325.1 hypothetical protein [Pandoraea capi]